MHHRIKKSVTNFRKSLEVRLKLAITLRHLATGETYTSLQYHWLVGQIIICNFVSVVCQVILAEFQEGYMPYRSSSDAQIFNCSKLSKKIKDGTLRLPPPEPLGEGGPDLHGILLCYAAFSIKHNSQGKRE